MSFTNVSSTHTATGATPPRLAIQHTHLPTALQGLLEPDAGKARPSGSKGAPAQQCAGATRQSEGIFAELKTVQCGSRAVMQSNTPDGIRQQIWAHLTVHHLTRSLIQHAATGNDRLLDPRRISFRRAQHLVRRSMPTSLVPAQQHRATEDAAARLAAKPNPGRRPRSYPRAIKRRTTPYPTKTTNMRGTRHDRNNAPTIRHRPP